MNQPSMDFDESHLDHLVPFQPELSIDPLDIRTHVINLKNASINNKTQ